MRSGGHLKDWTHPGMIRRMHGKSGLLSNSVPYYLQQTFPSGYSDYNCDGSTLALLPPYPVARFIVGKWDLCAREKVS